MRVSPPAFAAALILTLVGQLAMAGPAFVQRVLLGDLVNDAKTATALTAVLVSNNFGDDVLRRQEPLSASDGGDYWTIEGSFNRDRTSEGVGKLIAKVNKADARVISLMFDYVLIPPAEPPKGN